MPEVEHLAQMKPEFCGSQGLLVPHYFKPCLAFHLPLYILQKISSNITGLPFKRVFAQFSTV